MTSLKLANRNIQTVGYLLPYSITMTLW